MAFEKTPPIERAGGCVWETAGREIYTSAGRPVADDRGSSHRFKSHRAHDPTQSQEGENRSAQSFRRNRRKVGGARGYRQAGDTARQATDTARHT